jgi:hypothetical protein
LANDSSCPCWIASPTGAPAIRDSLRDFLSCSETAASLACLDHRVFATIALNRTPTVHQLLENFLIIVSSMFMGVNSICAHHLRPPARLCSGGAVGPVRFRFGSPAFAPRQLRRSSRHSVASATRRHGRPALSLWSYGSASPFSVGRELRLGKPSELNRSREGVHPSCPSGATVGKPRGRPPDITPRQVASAAPAIFLLVVSESGSEAERDPVGDVFTYRGANFD